MPFPFMLSALITAALLFPACAVLRRLGVVDNPNARSSHSLPTVRGGGVVIALTIGLSLFYLALESRSAQEPMSWRLIGLALAFLTLSVVSFVDDVRGLPAWTRFIVQVAAALSAVMMLKVSDLSPENVIWLAIAMLWIAGYTNAFNFMDGINGLAAIQALTTGIGTAMIASQLGLSWTAPTVTLCLLVAGAAAGFLPHNFPRATVFMGDVSSASLGFILAALGFWVSQQTVWWALFWIGLLHANFVLDTAITLVRRARWGHQLSTPHREHFYQRLIRAGRTHMFVSSMQGAIQVLATVILTWATNASWTVKGLVAVLVMGAWISFFWFAESQFSHRRGTGTRGA
jgi:UDP-N-acetylmuramyl pentapeptide phosphotransferase/UDP-N-acetylglucosamine-1-phosphate transferase